MTAERLRIIRATARALHRYHHPTLRMDSARCHCLKDALWAVRATESVP